MTVSANPLRVAQLVESLGAGGAEALAVDIAGALAARGHQSDLIVVRSEGPFRDRVAPDVVFQDLERVRHQGGQIARIVYFIGTCRRLEAHLRARRVDVLQTHLPYANFLGLAMGWRGVCRVYPTVHNNREFDYGDKAGRLKRVLRRAGYRSMLSHCQAMIAVSDEVKISMSGQLGVHGNAKDRIRVIRNGVRIPRRRTEVERMLARAAWDIGDGEVLIVGVGRLTRQKNFARLLDALSLLPREGIPWRCVIAGDGELRPELESRVSELALGSRVRLAGMVQGVPELMAAADIFCLPSLFEGLPLVLLEAMGSGLPTVAFAIAGVADVVADGDQALLVDPDDVAGLAASILALVKDPVERARLGEAARNLVATRYDFETVIDNLETAYRP